MKKRNSDSMDKFSVTLNVLTIITLPVVIIALLFGGTEKHGYYIQADAGINHYKWVNTYQEKAVYIGNNILLDSNGNEWEYADNSLKKGKSYILNMHDNGTETITDDVIYGIKNGKRGK